MVVTEHGEHVCVDSKVEWEEREKHGHTWPEEELLSAASAALPD